MRKKITKSYFRHFKSLYEPNSTTLTQVFNTIISLVFLRYSLSSRYEQQGVINCNITTGSKFSSIENTWQHERNSFSFTSIWFKLSACLARCDKLQHNLLVLSFPLSKILGSMKEILSSLQATGLSYQHVRKDFIWHHET